MHRTLIDWIKLFNALQMLMMRGMCIFSVKIYPLKWEEGQEDATGICLRRRTRSPDSTEEFRILRYRFLILEGGKQECLSSR